MMLKLTLACSHIYARVEQLKNASFFRKSSKSSSIVPALLTATRTVCIIYLVAQAAPRIFLPLCVSRINDSVVIFPSQID